MMSSVLSENLKRNFRFRHYPESAANPSMRHVFKRKPRQIFPAGNVFPFSFFRISGPLRGCESRMSFLRNPGDAFSFQGEKITAGQPV